MDFIKLILTSFGSLIALFILTKIAGNKQISELTMFDYIISISIGSIAAEMATELERPEKPLIAMAVYSLSALVISIISAKSMRIRRLIFGHSVTLMRSGKLYKENFKKSNLDISEFLMQCRLAGYYDITAIDTAVMEANGKISFMPYAAKRPSTPEDLKIVPSPESLFFNVIIDGEILTENLRYAGKDKNWLLNELTAQGYKGYKNIFLATLDNGGTLNIFEDTHYTEKNDYFQ